MTNIEQIISVLEKRRQPRLLGLCASLRAGRWGDGANDLVQEITSLDSEEKLKEFLKEQSNAHLENFLVSGRAEGKPFDEQLQEVRKRFGKRGLCNSEVILAAALWSAKQLGCDIANLSLCDYFPPTGQPRNLDELRQRLREASGYLISTPVYFGDRSSLAHDVIHMLAAEEDLTQTVRGRVAAGLAVGAKRNGGQETTLIYQIVDLVNAGLLAVGNDSETTSQYGGTCHAGDVGSAWKDEYGLWTSMGVGRRIARVLQLLSLADQVNLTGKIRVGFWLTQECDSFARRQVDRLCETYADEIEPVVMDCSESEFARCLACDICPTDLGDDEEYRCIVAAKHDEFCRTHSRFLDFDAIVPVAYVSADVNRVCTTYQRFNERTRYLRRGDYVFTDYAVAPMVFEELGAGDSLWIRMLTSTLRHHTVMTRPICGYVTEGGMLNESQVTSFFGQFLAQARRLTAGRLARAVVETTRIRYNPVGYTLGKLKDEEDEKNRRREQFQQNRNDQLRSEASLRLAVAE